MTEPAKLTVAEFIEGIQDGMFTPDQGEAILVWLCDDGQTAAHLWLWQGGRIVNHIPPGTVVGSTRVHWHAKKFVF